MLHDRSDLAVICNELGLKLAVEIGTHQGVFADKFLEKFNGTMICIDTWQDENHGPHQTFLPNFINQSLGREFDYKLAELLLGTKYKDRVQLRRISSSEASREFDEESIDFVYIDGGHSIPCVKRDILSWWPKVKRGGIMAGHDYIGINKHDPDLIGVAAVVNWFAVVNELDLHVTSEEIPSWYTKKL